MNFSKKLLSDDYNPQADLFLKIYKRCSINEIKQIGLENHIIDNSNSVRINAFIVLYKYIEDENDFEEIVKKILGNDKAEEMFLQWYNNEF